MLSAQFFRFALVGCIGFVVDALTFLLFNSIVANPYIARLGSYICAATATWWLNRHFTFRMQSLRATSLIKEWSRFLLSQTLGFCVNYGTFSLLIAYIKAFSSTPVLAIAAGSIAGLTVNFAVAKWLVFRHKKEIIR